MKIVFCGGGTAGHVTPNLALIDCLLEQEIYYIGTKGMEKELTEKYVAEGKIRQYFEISAVKLQRKLTLKNLAVPANLLKSIRQSKKILEKIRPDVVFSKGGYVGLPVVIAAKKLGISALVHESDMSLGLANKLSVLYGARLLSTYPCHKKAIQVGAIVRKEILCGNRQKGLETMQFDGKKPILLVMGGSLGAKSLNDAICQNRSLSDTFDIFVLSGKNKPLACDFVHSAEFVTNIADVYAATDVCVTRAGGNALAELSLANVPFVAVPLKKCSRGEQIKNAEWYKNNGLGICVDEDTLPQKLGTAVRRAYQNRNAFVAKQKAHREIFGTQNVVREILKYSSPRKQENTHCDWNGA